MEKYKSYGLSERQRDIAIGMLDNGKTEEYPYSIKEVEDSTLDAWISESEETPYVQFLLDAKNSGAVVYTLLWEWQEIGEIAVY